MQVIPIMYIRANQVHMNDRIWQSSMGSVQTLLCCVACLKNNIYWNQLMRINRWCEDGFNMFSHSLSLSIILLNVEWSSEFFNTCRMLWHAYQTIQGCVLLAVHCQKDTSVPEDSLKILRLNHLICPVSIIWNIFNFEFLRRGPFPKFGAMGQEQHPPDHIDPPAKQLDVSAKPANPTILDATVSTIGAVRQSCQSWRGDEIVMLNHSLACAGRGWNLKRKLLGLLVVPSCSISTQQCLWIARITLCSAAWFFETGPDLRIFHRGETYNKAIQNPWLLLIRFSTTVCCEISKQVPESNTHLEELSKPAMKNMLWVQQNTTMYNMYTYVLWQAPDFMSRLCFMVLHGASYLYPCLTAVAPSLGASCGKVSLRPRARWRHTKYSKKNTQHLSE